MGVQLTNWTSADYESDALPIALRRPSYNLVKLLRVRAAHNRLKLHELQVRAAHNRLRLFQVRAAHNLLNLLQVSAENNRLKLLQVRAAHTRL